MLVDNQKPALTLNGRKWKLQKPDFDNLLKSFKVNNKAIGHVYEKFRKILPRWYDLIDISFLPEQMKEEHKQFIQNGSALLKI